MLKLNSSGGKLDITITDDSLFGTSRKPAVKPQRERVVSRAANSLGRHQKKQAGQAEKAPKAKENKSTKIIKNASNSRTMQNKLPVTSEGKKADKSRAVTEKVITRGSSVISQAKLDNILSLLNNGQGNEAASNLSPEQLSVLVTSLNKLKPAEQQVQQVNKSKSQQNDSQRKSANRAPPLSESSQKEKDHLIKNTKQVEDGKGLLRKELDGQVISKRRAKELEKQKEGAAFEEYNPWGRPGAGAPIRSQSGKVLADYQHRVTKESVEPSQHDNASAIPKGSSFSTNYSRPGPVSTVACSTANVDTTLPVALRSSFAVGAPGLVSNETQQKRLQELQWKQELEKQIEEKKERDRQRKLKEDQEDLLNLSWSNKHTQPAQKDTIPSQARTVGTDNPALKPVPGNIETQEASDATNSFLNHSLNGSFNRSSHARGFGMHTLDLQSQEEAEKKRLKRLEHQRAIQEQVEENRRKKQQEKEQRLREEAIEEARLAKERETLNQAFAIEQKRKKEKEEEAKRINEALQQSVLDAYESAQQAKREKRKKQLEAGSQSRRGGAPSRSYVVSRTSSLAQHVISHDRTSQLSNYPTPRGHDSPRNKSHGHVTSHSQSSLGEPFIPPLNFNRGDSPPVPTLRNKLPRPVNPSSQRSATTPTSVKPSHFQRTVNSAISEPTDGSLACSTRRDTQRSEVAAGFLTSLDELSSARLQAEEPPFDTVENAFMIPYHRTDSATLPAPPDTPAQDAVPSPTKTVTTKDSMKKSTRKYPGKEAVLPMYRSESTHLKPSKINLETSPRKTKGTKPVSKQAPSSKGVVKKSLKDSINSTQTRANKQVDKKQRSPRIDAALSRLSRHQDIPETLTTPRQELILQQLAALRQGLIMKEQELKQGI